MNPICFTTVIIYFNKNIFEGTLSNIKTENYALKRHMTLDMPSPEST